jgi:hypothetical protein
VIEAICGAIEVGVSFADACQASGISRTSGYEWLDLGREFVRKLGAGEVDAKELTPDQKQYLKFCTQFQSSEATGAINMATVVYNAGMSDPDYALRWLERRRPAEWSGRNNVDVKHSGGVGLTHDGEVAVTTPQIMIYIPDNGRGDSSAVRMEGQPPEMGVVGDAENS